MLELLLFDGCGRCELGAGLGQQAIDAGDSATASVALSEGGAECGAGGQAVALG